MRGLGLANLLRAYEAGIRCFDGAVGGLGGCPYSPGASGNVATEEIVFMFEEMGISTGIDLPALLAAALNIKGKLPGAIFRSALLDAGLPKPLGALK
jgi:hydroxymethylglutaryl-CoA lyase